MTQPMTKAEIEVWDAIAIQHIYYVSAPRAFAKATEAIAARRAALIADARVGTVAHNEFGGWLCRCHDGIAHMESDYCEACHTRRPDAEVTP